MKWKGVKRVKGGNLHVWNNFQQRIFETYTQKGVHSATKNPWGEGDLRVEKRTCACLAKPLASFLLRLRLLNYKNRAKKKSEERSRASGRLSKRAPLFYLNFRSVPGQLCPPIREARGWVPQYVIRILNQWKSRIKNIRTWPYDKTLFHPLATR